MKESEPRKSATERELCPSCSRKSLKVGGPLWIGKIQSSDFVSECAKHSDNELFFDSRGARYSALLRPDVSFAGDEDSHSEDAGRPN